MDIASIAGPLRLSFVVAGVTTVFTALIGTALAYLLASKRFWGKEALDIVLMLPLVLPPTVVGYYLVALLSPRGPIGSVLSAAGIQVMFTLLGAGIASFVVSFPLMISTSRAAIEAVDPTLVDASYTLGRGEWDTATRVVLPVARGGIAAGIILAFARALGEFGATLMLAGNIPGKTDTMPIAIYSAFNAGDTVTANTLVVIFTLLSALVLYAAHRLTKGVGPWR